MAAKTISNLSVVLGANLSPFASAFRSAGGIVEKFSSQVSSAGGAILKLTGIGAGISLGMKALESVLAAPGDALAAAEKQIQAETKLAAVLRATAGAAGFSADQLKQHAAALQSSTTFGDEAIIEMQATLATFRNISGDTFTRATSLALDLSSVLGTDLQGSAIELGKALNDPVQGMTALRRVGVSFTQQQIAQIKSLQQSGDLLGAQKIILDQLQQSFGGAAEAMAATPFGKFKQLGNLFGDLKEKIGTGLARALAGIASAFHLDKLIESAGEAVGKLVDRLAPIGSAILAGIVPPIEAAAGFVMTAFAAVGTFIANHSGMVIAAIEGIGIALAAIAVPAALVSLAGILAFIGVSAPIAAIGALAGAIAFVIQQTIGWSAAWGYVVSASQAVAGVLATVWNAIYGTVAPVVQAVWQVIVANWASIVDLTVGVFQGIWNVISAVSGAIWSALTSIWGGITAAWGAAMDFLGVKTLSSATIIGDILQTLADWFKWIAEGVTLAMNIAAYAITHWRDTALLIGTEVVYQVVLLGNQIQYVFTQVIPTVLTWFSNNWRDVFTTLANFTYAVMDNLATNIINVVKNIPGLIKGTVNFSDIWTPLTTGFESAIKELPKIPARVAGPLEDSLKKDRDNLRDSYSQGLGEFLAKQGSSAGEALQKGFGKSKPEFALPKVETPKLDTSGIRAPAIAAQDAISGIGKAAKETATDLKLLVSGSAESQLARYAGMWDSVNAVTQAVTAAAPAISAPPENPASAAGPPAQFPPSPSAPGDVSTAEISPLPATAVSGMQQAASDQTNKLLSLLIDVSRDSNLQLRDIASQPADEILDL